MAITKRGLKAARKAVRTYEAHLTDGFDDLETALGDLIADLMHLADSKDLDSDMLIDRARDLHDFDRQDGSVEYIPTGLDDLKG